MTIGAKILQGDHIGCKFKDTNGLRCKLISDKQLQPVVNYKAIAIIKGRVGERKSPEATLMAVSVNTKGVVKSVCCLHSLVVEVIRFVQLGRLVGKSS